MVTDHFLDVAIGGVEAEGRSMRVTLAASLLSLLPVAFAAEPASAQTKRGSVYLSLMG